MVRTVEAVVFESKSKGTKHVRRVVGNFDREFGGFAGAG
jgi:hypothetical protein